MMYFLDTSALLKRYVEEIGSDYIRQLLTRTDLSFHQSFLTPLEMTSALYRRHRSGQLSNPELVQILNAYTAHTQDRYGTVLHSTHLMNLAASLIARHPLRTLDAIQLAAALTLRSTLPLDASILTFVSADDRLIAIARLENFPTDNPNDRP